MTIEGGLAVASDRARLSIQQVAGRPKYEQKRARVDRAFQSGSDVSFRNAGVRVSANIEGLGRTFSRTPAVTY